MVKLLIADDHTVLRHALSEMLQSRGGFEILGHASDGEELLKMLQGHNPDIIIMDVGMPKLNGIETMQKMCDQGMKLPVLILSADEGEKNIRAALKAGAKGYIPKNSTIEELEFAINAILEGKTYLSPSVTSVVMRGGAVENGVNDPLEVLTKREREILTFLAEGLPNRDIAKKLFISIRTVDTHRSNILKKLNVRTNADLVRLAIANGLVHV